MRVLLSGYYGYGNLGDEALLSGLLGGLSARGLEPTVLSGDPAATRALHGVAAAHRYRALVSALARCDAVVSGGGGLLQDTTSKRSLSYYLSVLRLAQRLGKRTLVYGQSVGPLSERGRRHVARALTGLPIAVRDAPSLQLLAGLGLDAQLVADAALLLTPPARGQREGPVLLVPRAGQHDLNTALGAAGRLLRGAGVPVSLLGLNEREDEHALAELEEALGIERQRAADPRAALKRAASARYVLSVRLHGLVFAAIAGTGFAGLVYDPKVAGFLAGAGAPAFSHPIDAHALAATAAAAQPPDAEAIGRLRERAQDGLDWLARQLLG